MTDEEAINLYRQGSISGLGFIYDKYFPVIYRYLYWQTHDVPTAEDLTSETMLTLSRSLFKFRGDSSFKNYLFQIAKNVLSHWLKKNKYELPLLTLTESALPTPADLINPDHQEQNIQKLNLLLSKLSAQDKKLIQLRYLRNYSVAETAKSLQLSESNVKIKTMRILKKLSNL